jgi:glucose/arabinose dehydrogenase/PKD repeat protein
MLRLGMVLGFCAALSAWSGDILDGNFPATHSTYVTSPNLNLITSMAWAPDNTNRLFVTRKDGELRIVQNGTLLGTPFATLTVYTNSECGLLSVCFDPNYATNKYVYVFRTLSSSEQQIVRFTDTNNVGQNMTVIVPGLPTAGQNHDGGGISIGPDGKIYWAIGDNGNGTGVNADMTSLAAKLGRANLDGTVPTDNPFIDGPGGNNDYIWARGLRNPFTHTWQASTGKLWMNVVGTNWEQVFVIGRGDHAGYNNYENNQPNGFLPPVIAYSTNSSTGANRTISSVSRSANVATYTTTANHMFRVGGNITVSGVANTTFNGTFYIASTPSLTTFTVAQAAADATDTSGGTIVPLAIGGCITGGAFYDSTLFAPQYRGNFFFGDYNSGRLQRVVLDSNNNIASVDYFASNLSGMIDVNVGPDGALYYARHNGTIYRLVPTSPAQGLVVTPGNLIVAEGGTGVYAIRLASAPAADVTVSIARSAGSANLSVSGSPLIFTPANFATPQYVTITAAQDSDITNDSATFTLSASGFTSITVNAVTIDDDAQTPVLSATTLTIAEGGNGTFTVKLPSQPTGSVTVTVARTAGDSDISVSGGATLNFDNTTWNTAQTVTISSATDGDTANDLATITVSATGLTPVTVSVTATDSTAGPPTISSTPILVGAVEALYTYDVDASGTPASTFSLLEAPTGMTIDAQTGVIHWTPSVAGSFKVNVQAANGNAPAATQSFTITVSNDRPPTATITQPVDGAVLSGKNAEFYGDGHDDVGTTKAEFYVDGVLQYTDSTPGSHYHYNGSHALFDTTLFPNGAHRLRMTVYDTVNQSGSIEVDVTFDNAGNPPAPVISSGIQASLNPAVAGSPVTFTASAENSASLTWKWDFGDGSTSTTANSAQHTYANPGTFPVRLTVTNSAGAASLTKMSLIVVLPSQADSDNDGKTNDVDPDNDNDGVSDQMELAMGTDPLNAQSVNKAALTVSQAHGSAKFQVQGHDTWSLSGIFPALPALFDPAGKTVFVNLNGAMVAFTLDAKGRAKNDSGTFQLRLKKKRNADTKKSEFPGGPGPFKASLKAGTWSDNWLSAGFDPNVPKATINFAAEVALNGVVYVATVTVDYASQKAKTARFKAHRTPKSK